MRLAEIHGLRAYDAVRLAAALELNGRWLAGGLTGITLVSADQDLNIAALAESLMVENPNLHPSSTPLSADAFDFPPTPAVSNERRRSPVKTFTIELPDDTALPFGDSGRPIAPLKLRKSPTQDRKSGRTFPPNPPEIHSWSASQCCLNTPTRDLSVEDLLAIHAVR